MPTLSTRGQIVIPARICRSRGWEPGQELDIVESDGEAVLAALDRLGSVVKYTGTRVPVEKMGVEAIAYRDLYPDGE